MLKLGRRARRHFVMRIKICVQLIIGAFLVMLGVDDY